MYFIDGSLAQMGYDALKYDDIIRIEGTLIPMHINIICKPSYDINKILEFTSKHILICISFDIIVEEKLCGLMKKQN